MSKLATIIWALIGFTLLSIILMIPALLIDGFVLLRLYEWLIMPTFHSAPEVTLSKMIGISVFFGFLTRQWIKNEKDADDENGMKHLATLLTFMYVAPFVTLLTGYIVHFWI